ncbi:unnamed protein product [Mucor hiemalis]
MPGPVTIFSLGAVGAAGAAVYVNNRRNSMNTDTEVMTPFALARRRSSTVTVDHDWSRRKQAEHMWRRDNGVSFSHNSEPKYPTGQNNSSNKLQQTSSFSK